MIHRLFIKLLIRFLTKTIVGKFFNFFGKLLFGQFAFVTGYNPVGFEFYKTTTTKRIDKLFLMLKETGYTQLAEHDNMDSVEITLRNLATARRRNS